MFNVQKWSALAPGLKEPGDWEQWLSTGLISGTVDKISPATVPAGLRRRLSPQGKLEAASATSLLRDDEQLPVVFASRHGDVSETLKLLAAMGNDEALSPARFSMSVHNAICGILSIARRDTSPVTAVSCSDDLLFATLIEASCQLQEFPRVLCIMGDCPLPDPYQKISTEVNFPWALSLVLSRDQGMGFDMQPVDGVHSGQGSASPRDLIGLLVGHDEALSLKGGQWRLQRQTPAHV